MKKCLTVCLLFVALASQAQQVDTLDAAVATSRTRANYLSKGKELRTEVISSAGPATAAAPLNLTFPAIQKEKKEKKVVTATYKVSMHCKNCAAKITDNISFMKGVEDLKVSLEKKTVTVSYNPAKTDEATLVKAIEKLGYSVEKVQ